MLRRSVLFMPGNTPAMLLSAPVLGADSVILDLEDAVALHNKDSARILVSEALQSLDFGDVETIVRVNPVHSPYWQQDLHSIVSAKPDAIMIPKACRADVLTMERYVEALEKHHGITLPIAFMLIAESAYGVEMLHETLQCSKRIQAVLLGAEDLSADLEIKRTKTGQEIAYARAKVAMVCKAFQVQAIDTPFTDVDDFEGLRQDTTMAKSLGFFAKACINPRQVDVVHDVLAPTQAEIQEAMDIVSARDTALAQGLGVFSHRGKMVDMPIILRAEKTIAIAGKLGLSK